MFSFAVRRHVLLLGLRCRWVVNPVPISDSSTYTQYTSDAYLTNLRCSILLCFQRWCT